MKRNAWNGLFALLLCCVLVIRSLSFAEILARIDGMSEEEYATFLALIEEYFPEEGEVLQITLEIEGVNASTTRYERYSFEETDSGAWVFSKLAVANS